MPQPPPIFMSQDLAEFQRQQEQQGTASEWGALFPPAGPAEEVFDPEPLAYFENIGPIDETIIWNNQPIKVQFQLLDVFEERQLISDIEAINGAGKILVERQWRIGRSLLSVNGQRVHFSDDWVTDRLEREAWAERFPAMLLYVLSQAYERAANRPLILLKDLQTDPKAEPAP